MHLTPQSQAILMLTAFLGKATGPLERPLTNTEWAKFTLWLRDHKLNPAQLLAGDLPDLLAGWVDAKVSVPRLEWLLGRGAALGLAVEKWERAGLWILTRSDPEYPERLKKKLGIGAPPVLIGCGNKQLLNQGGVAVVGSRNASEDDLSYTHKLGVAVSHFGKSIVSGGARGVDLTAMEATLEADGTCVGVLADSLLRASVSARFRKHLTKGSLVLVSPFNPEAGFDVGNAMARNRYIYCLSDCAVVIDSTKGKGGTWNGAVENLKHKWVLTFVKPVDDPNAGNTALLGKGAGQATLDVSELFKRRSEADFTPAALDAKHDEKSPTDVSAALPEANAEVASSLPVAKERLHTSEVKAVSLFETFMVHLLPLLDSHKMKVEEVVSELELERGQAKAWLERAANEGLIAKHNRPVRFSTIVLPTQPSLFGYSNSNYGN